MVDVIGKDCLSADEEDVEEDISDVNWNYGACKVEIWCGSIL